MKAQNKQTRDFKHSGYSPEFKIPARVKKQMKREKQKQTREGREY